MTEEVMSGDYFHTGDIGEVDDEGFLKITDRKKEMFKTSGGKYIAPQVIESQMKQSLFIGISSSGKSENVVSALNYASYIGANSFLITASDIKTNKNINNLK